MKIEDIKIGKRRRKDLGDIDALAANILDLGGLIQPIIVEPDGQLVAGYRRLEAVKKLGWTEVPTFVVNTFGEVLRALKAERDENVQRKGYTPSEALDAAAEIEPLEREAARERMLAGKPSAKFSEGRALDKVATAVGMTRPTLVKAKAVVAAAEVEPEAYAELVARMDKTGKVDGAYKKLVQLRLQKKREEYAAGARVEPAVITGDFRIIGRDLQDNSIDMIFTDPPYAHRHLPLFSDLAQLAARVLRPGGLCLTYAGQTYLPDVYRQMGEHLSYLWTCGIVQETNQRREHRLHIWGGCKPLLLWYKPPLEIWWGWFTDMTKSERQKDAHEWQQGIAQPLYYIDKLCPVGGTVVDPMCASGTSLVAAKRLGRKYIGIEIDPKVADYARRRLADDAAEAEPTSKEHSI